MTPPGPEQLQDSTEKTGASGSGGAESGAPARGPAAAAGGSNGETRSERPVEPDGCGSDLGGTSGPRDPDLAAIAALWPRLSEAKRQAIRAMVEADADG